MNAYTISKLAEDAGVSIDIVRDYQIRGMLQPCDCSDCGYSIYDEAALSLFVSFAPVRKWVTLNDIASLCKAIDAQDKQTVLRQKAAIGMVLSNKMNMLASFKLQLKKIR